MEMFAFASAVHGYHVYQDVWKIRVYNLKIQTNGSLRSHHFYWKQWLTKGFNMFNLSLVKVFSSIYDPSSPFTPSESNCLLYKPHPWFLAQNFSKKVWLIHKCLLYVLDLVCRTIIQFLNNFAASSKINSTCTTLLVINISYYRKSSIKPLLISPCQ